MSWFWGSKPSQEDPTKKLDPALRDFLESETPKQHDRPQTEQRRAPPRAPDTASTEYRSQLGLDVSGPGSRHQNTAGSLEDRPQVPAESLYQDGRYAHLWKTYRSQGEVEATMQGDQDRMKSLLDGLKDRRAAIGRAAIENCVVEQMEQRECFSAGSISMYTTMCRAESRKFNRCYEMQSRFLKALGYLSQPRSQDEEERIQMHADKLYHQMLERERLMMEAKKTGSTPPAMPAMLLADETEKALGPDSSWARMRAEFAARGETAALTSFSPEQQNQIMEKLRNLSEHDRNLELQLLAADLRVKKDLVHQLKSAVDEEVSQRRSRRETGQETFGDTLKRWWGWEQ